MESPGKTYPHNNVQITSLEESAGMSMRPSQTGQAQRKHVKPTSPHNGFNGAAWRFVILRSRRSRPCRAECGYDHAVRDATMMARLRVEVGGLVA